MTGEFKDTDVDPLDCAVSEMVSDTVETVFTDPKRDRVLGRAEDDDWVVPVAHRRRDNDNNSMRAAISGVQWFEAVSRDKLSNEGVAGVRKKIPVFSKIASKNESNTRRWQREVWMHRSSVVSKANEELRRRGHRGQIAELLAYWRDETPHLAAIPNLVVVTRRSPGVQLATLIADGKPLPPVEAATIIKNIAEFVAACHAVGLIIGDISQYNVLVVNDNGEFSHVDMCDLEFGDWAEHPQQGMYGATDNVATALDVEKTSSMRADLTALAHRANFLFTGGVGDEYPYATPKMPLPDADIPFLLRRLLETASATTRISAALKDGAVEVRTVEAFGTWVDHLTKRPEEPKFEYVSRVVEAAGDDHPWIIAGLVEWAKTVVPNPSSPAWEDPSTPPAVLLAARTITTTDPETAADLLGPVADFATPADIRVWCEQAGLDHAALAGSMRANHSVGKVTLAEAFPESEAWQDAVERRPAPQKKAGRKPFGSNAWCDQVVARARRLHQPDLAGSYSIRYADDDADGLAFEVDVNGHLVEFVPHPADRAATSSTVTKREVYQSLVRDRRTRADMPEALNALLNVAPAVDEVQAFTKRDQSLETREGVPRAPLISRKFLSDKWLATFAEQSPREADPNIEPGDVGVRIKDNAHLSFTATVSSDGHIVSLRRGVNKNARSSAPVTPEELWTVLYLGDLDGELSDRSSVKVLSGLGPSAKDVRSWTTWDKSLGSVPVSPWARKRRGREGSEADGDAGGGIRGSGPVNLVRTGATKARMAGEDALVALVAAVAVIVQAPIRMLLGMVQKANRSDDDEDPSTLLILLDIAAATMTVPIFVLVLIELGIGSSLVDDRVGWILGGIGAACGAAGWVGAAADNNRAWTALCGIQVGMFGSALLLDAVSGWLLIPPVMLLIGSVAYTLSIKNMLWLARAGAVLWVIAGSVAALMWTGLSGAFAPEIAARTHLLGPAFDQPHGGYSGGHEVGANTVVSYGASDAQPHIATAAARFDADHGLLQGPVTFRGDTDLRFKPVAYLTELVNYPEDPDTGVTPPSYVSTDFTFEVTETTAGLGDLDGRLVVVGVYEHPDDTVHGSWPCPQRMCATVEAATSVNWNPIDRGYSTTTERHPVNLSVAPLRTTISRDGEQFSSLDGDRVIFKEGDRVFGYSFWPELAGDGAGAARLRILGIALLNEPISTYSIEDLVWDAEVHSTRMIPESDVQYLMDGRGLTSLGDFRPGVRVLDAQELQASLEPTWTPDVEDGDE